MLPRPTCPQQPALTAERSRTELAARTAPSQEITRRRTERSERETRYVLNVANVGNMRATIGVVRVFTGNFGGPDELLHRPTNSSDIAEIPIGILQHASGYIQAIPIDEALQDRGDTVCPKYFCLMGLLNSGTMYNIDGGYNGVL